MDQKPQINHQPGLSSGATGDASENRNTRLRVPGFLGNFIGWFLLFNLLAFVLFEFALPVKTGCKDPVSANYDPFALKACEDCCVEDPHKGLEACMDTLAVNFNPNALAPCSDCCSYRGCMDSNALNYAPLARIPCTSCCDYPKYGALADLSDGNSGAKISEPLPIELVLPDGLHSISANGLFFFYKWRSLLFLLSAASLLAFIVSGLLFRRRLKKEEKNELATGEASKTQVLSFQEDAQFQALASAMKRGGGTGKSKKRYLFFIEEKSDGSYQTDLFEHLCRELMVAGIPIERFLFLADAEKFHNEANPDGKPLKVILSQFPKASLFFFTDGAGFLDSQQKVKRTIFQSVSKRSCALISPKSVKAWGVGEESLSTVFQIAPATMSGLEASLLNFDNPGSIKVSDWKKEEEANLRGWSADSDSLLKDLEHYLDEGLLKLLVVFTNYSQLTGAQLLQLANAFHLSGTVGPYFDKLMQISQLTWFKKGRLPAEISKKLAISAQLTDEDKKCVERILGFEKKRKKKPRFIILVFAGVVFIGLFPLSGLQVRCFEEAFTLPGSPELFCLSEGHEDRATQTIALHRFVRYLDRYALDEATFALEAVFQPANRDSVPIAEWESHLNLVYGAIYNQALELYGDGYYNLSVTLVNRMHLACREVLAGYDIFLGPVYEGFAPFQLKLDRLWYLMGLNFYYLEDPITATLYQDAIENYGTDEVEVARVPNLSHLLTYEAIDTFSEGRLRVRHRGRYGFLDEEGLPVPDSLGRVFNFDFAYNFSEGKALVREGNNYFRVDKDLNVLDNNFFSSWNPATDSLTGKQGFRDENGNWVIVPQYPSVFPYSGDLARVQLDDGTFTFIRRQGKVFVRETFEEARDFSYGYAAVKKNGKWGYLDITGKFRIPARFDTAGDFNNRYRAPVEWAGEAFEVNINGYCVSANCPETSFRVEVIDAATSKPVSRVRFYNETWGTYYSNDKGAFELVLPLLNLPLNIRFFVVADGYTGGAKMLRFTETEKEIRILLE